MILLHSTESKYFKKNIKSPRCVSITVCAPADTATGASTSVTARSITLQENVNNWSDINLICSAS